MTATDVVSFLYGLKVWICIKALKYLYLHGKTNFLIHTTSLMQTPLSSDFPESPSSCAPPKILCPHIVHRINTPCIGKAGFTLPNNISIVDQIFSQTSLKGNVTYLMWIPKVRSSFATNMHPKYPSVWTLLGRVSSKTFSLLSYLGKTNVPAVSAVWLQTSVLKPPLWHAAEHWPAACMRLCNFSPALESDQCHAIAEKNRPENRWRALITEQMGSEPLQ